VRFLGLGHQAELFQLVNQCDYLRVTGDNSVVLLDNLGRLVLRGMLVLHGLVVRLHFVHCLHLYTLQPVLDRRGYPIVQILLLLLLLAIVIQDGHKG